MAVPLESIVSFMGLTYTNFVFLSTTTKIESKPQLFGNFTIKSIDTCC